MGGWGEEVGRGMMGGGDGLSLHNNLLGVFVCVIFSESLMFGFRKWPSLGQIYNGQNAPSVLLTRYI